ncbi:hypothetical protein B4O85_21970 [Pseudomonas azotoformans]|uniref:Uncharacterized protein n=1 Tax=Pseudomonas azotoformans TaxID=47878 RepID=A0A4V1K0I5_PSEAZ|nr:hypothetical protein B4O85_21970 [Pseudomonas azotoformans]
MCLLISPLSVGASLLAKNSQAPRSFSKHALSLTSFASKLAPTKGKTLSAPGQPISTLFKAAN